MWYYVGNDSSNSIGVPLSNVLFLSHISCVINKILDHALTNLIFFYLSFYFISHSADIFCDISKTFLNTKFIYLYIHVIYDS